MSPILGIWASSFRSAAGPEGAYDALATVTLSSATNSINFTGIPSGYKHLQLRSTFLGDTTTAYDAIIRFNSDSASAYNWHRLYGNGTSALAQGSGTTTAMYLGADATRTLYPTVSVIDLLDYNNTGKFKTMRNLSGFDWNGSGGIALWSGLWRSTEPITSINISVVSNNFAIGSSFALYGVK